MAGVRRLCRARGWVDRKRPSPNISSSRPPDALVFTGLVGTTADEERPLGILGISIRVLSIAQKHYAR